MIAIKTLNLISCKDELARIPKGKVLINTINAYSFNTAHKDEAFAEALKSGGYLIPDGISIVGACRWLHAKVQPRERIAGYDLFELEMRRLNMQGGTCMFIGASEKVHALIRERAKEDYPNIKIETYIPPYKDCFSVEDSDAIIEAINKVNPDLLWIGMTAPKQEKWIYNHWNNLNIHCHVGTVGAVFDFYAGTVKRAPLWWQKHGLEWLYRFMQEPCRLWRRYLIGNAEFMWYIVKEKIEFLSS